MKLYYSRGACSLAVRILIHELNIPCEFESVDLKTKKTETGQDFLKINPKGQVPTLGFDNSESLSENTAIQIYLAESHKARDLLPSENDFKRYRVIEWFSFVASDIHKSYGPLFNPKITGENKEIFIEHLKNKLNFINDHLSKNNFLLGSTYILPDGYFFVTILWMKHFKIERSTWPNIDRYFSELKKRASIAKSLQEEGINAH